MYDLGNQFKINQKDLVVNPKCVISGEKFRIQILTDRLIRLEYNENIDGKFVDSASSLVVRRKFDEPYFDFKEDEHNIYISTKYFQIKYYKNAKFTEKSLSGYITASKKEWFYTQKEVKNYGGTTISLDNTLKMPSLEKGLFNPDMFVVIDDSNNLLLDEFSNVYKRDIGSKDIYLLAYSNDFNEVLKDYFTLTGSPAFIPRYALGNWWSRDIPYQDEHITVLLNKFRMNSIPISVFLFDKDWSIKNNKLSTTSGFTFNNRLIKNPENLVNWLHQMNIKVGVKINPKDGIFPHEAYFNEARNYIQVNKKVILILTHLIPVLWICI